MKLAAASTKTKEGMLMMKKFSRCGVLVLLVFAVMSVAPVTAQSAMLDSVLFRLCGEGTAKDVREALAAGADANVSIIGITALMKAASDNSDPEVVKALLRAGADVNAKNDDLLDITALMWAAEKNPNPEVVKALLAGGADVHAKDQYGKTALIRAAGNNSNPNVVKVLLTGGADIHARDDGGDTALMYAAAFNPNPEVVKVLLENGADAKGGNKGMTALMWAAMDNSNPEVVKMLLEAGADVSAVDEDGHDALWWYAQKNKNKQVKEILEKAKNENPIKYYFKKFIKFIGDNKEYVLIILIAFLILIELCKIMRRK